MKAVGVAASVTAGRTRASHPVYPATGNHPSRRLNKIINIKPSQKLGSASPTRTASVELYASTLRGRTADSIPTVPPTAVASTRAAAVSLAVFGSRDMTSDTTLRLLRIERPRSPVTAWPTYRAYWTYSGRSRPNSRRIAVMSPGLAESDSITSTGSPGARWIIRKTPTETPNVVTIASTNRLARYSAIACASGLDERAVKERERLDVEHEAADACLHGPRIGLRVIWDVGQILGENGLCLRVQVLTLRGVQRQPGLLKQAIDDGALIAGPIGARID